MFASVRHIPTAVALLQRDAESRRGDCRYTQDHAAFKILKQLEAVGS